MSRVERKMVQVDGLDAEGLAEIVATAVQEALDPYRTDLQALRDAALASQSLLDAHGLAHVLGVSERSVARYVEDGMPYRQARPGSKRLFYVPEVADYLKRGDESASRGRDDDRPR